MLSRDIQCEHGMVNNPYAPSQSHDSTTLDPTFSERRSCPICDLRHRLLDFWAGGRCTLCGSRLTFAGPFWLLCLIGSVGIGGVLFLKWIDATQQRPVTEDAGLYIAMPFLVWLVVSILSLLWFGRFYVQERGRSLASDEINARRDAWNGK